MFEAKEIRLIIYYLAIVSLYVVASIVGIDASSVVRFVVLGLLFGPLILGKSEWIPVVTVLFFTLVTSNYATSLLPSDSRTYLFVLLLSMVMFRPKLKYPAITHLVLMAILTCLINFVNYGAWENISETLIILITFFFFVPFNEEKQVVVFSYAFVLISLVISITTYFLGSNYTITYVSENLDRTSLVDPNYAACVVGMGIVSGAIILFKGYAKQLVVKIIIVLTMVASLFVLAANASRTSFLAIAAAVVVLLFFSKIKTGYKVLFSALIGGLILFMYNNAYFDILQYRIENDVGGGSNRTIIWEQKLNAFSNGDIFNQLFGFGYEPGRDLGTGEAFHNDFLAFMVEYGIIGLICLILFFIIPFKHCGIRKSKAPALTCLVYIFIVSLTLEPFAAGRLTFYAFWFYTLLFAVLDENPSTD